MNLHGRPCRFSNIALCVAALCLSACAHSNASYRHIPKPGYTCRTGEAYQNGAWGTLTVTPDGQPVEMHWEWSHSQGVFLPKLGLIGSAKGTLSPDPNDGFGVVSWGMYVPGKRPGLMRLELTNAPDSIYWRETPFATDFARSWNGSVYANWGDLSAFAKGSDKLFAVFRDRNGKVVNRADVNPKTIVEASPLIADVIRNLREQATNYQASCEYTDDLEPDIVVT